MENPKYTFMRYLLVSLIFQWTAYCHADLDNPLQAKVDNFSCKNVMISRAISLLSKKSPVPINCIVHYVSDLYVNEQPFVTIPERQGTVGDFLKEILASQSDYDVLLKQGTILVIPKGYETNKSFPLNRFLKKYTVKYSKLQVSNANENELYRCDMTVDPQYRQLNIPLEFCHTKRRPDFPEFPVFVTYENQTLLDILISISKKVQAQWCCLPRSAKLVKASNKCRGEFYAGWPNENGFYYQIFWESGGPPPWGRDRDGKWLGNPVKNPYDY